MFSNAISTNEGYEVTPDLLFARIRHLEDNLMKNKLTKTTMNELLDLYTVILKTQ